MKHDEPVQEVAPLRNVHDLHTWQQAELTKAKAFVLNVTGLALSTGLVGGLVWVATHLEVVFG